MGRVKLIPIIIAGGRGTRFWPLSRRKKPKQLLDLISKKPLIRETYERLAPVSGKKEVYISTSKDLVEPIKKILPEIPEKNYLVEPEPRDTAPGIGLALAMVSRELKEASPEPVLAFLPSDHYIKKPAEFRKVLKKAGEIAYKKNLIVTIGIKPSFPSTSYGYIQPKEPISGYKDAYFVKRFKEKPDLRRAKRYVSMGFFWNAGIFIATPSLLWELFERYQPTMAEVLKKISTAPDARLVSTINREFPKLTKISFDYAIMEQAKEVGVVAGEFGWSDVGGYYALYQLLGGDGDKNISFGRLVERKSRGNFVRAEKLVALVGVSELAVIESEDAILVMNLKEEAELKNLIAQLEKSGLKKYL